MPTRKSAPRWHAAAAVEATLTNVENVEAAMAVAEAIEVPAEDATPRDEGGTRKRSRIHEVFIADPNYADYVVCHCSEKVAGGHLCGGRLKPGGSTKPLWNHVEKKHLCTYARLSSQRVRRTVMLRTLQLPKDWPQQQSLRSMSHISRWWSP